MSHLMRQLMGVYMDKEGDEGAAGGGETPEQKAARESAAATAAAAAAAAAAAEAAKRGATTDAEAKLLKEVMAKKEALKTATEKVAALEAQVKKFEGIDPDKVRALLSDKAAAEEAELVRKGEFDKIKAQMNTAHEAQLAAERAKIAEKDTQVSSLQSTIANLTVGTAFQTSAFIREDLALTPTKARVIYGAHFEFDREKSAVIAYDKPAGTKNRAPLVDGKGEPLAFDEAFRKIIDADPEKDTMLKSKVRQGANSGTTTLKPGEKDPTAKTMSAVDKISAGLKQMEAAAKKPA